MACTRRAALTVLAAIAGSRLGAAGAQPREAQRRIGFLSGWGPPPPGTPSGLAKLLAQSGFEEGRNLSIERRYGEGSPEKLAAFARELAALRVEVIIAAGNTAIASAKQATSSIPIVMMYGIAPLEAGFIESLAKPGGNVTGNAFHTAETGAKIFDLLREAFPRARRAAMLWNPTRAGYSAYEKVLTRVAAERGVTLGFVGVQRLEEVPRALESVESMRAELLLVANDVSLMAANPRIAEFARVRKLPSIGTVPQWVEAGGLMYYGPDESETLPGTGRYVVRILQGAKPSELPIEQPSKFQFHVNAGTARAIGYKLPDSILIRADRVIDP